MQGVASADRRRAVRSTRRTGGTRACRTHLSFLEALLQAELEDREHWLVERRIRESYLPRTKTLEEFDFSQCPKVSPQQIHELAEGGRLLVTITAAFSARSAMTSNRNSALTSASGT